jgi:CRP/FNR family cyclic AMP-dependent transcriptional regulator
MRKRIPKEQIQLLRAVPLFSNCSESELRSIASLGTAVDVDEGAYLTRKGEPGREFFLVLDGEASCRVRRKELHRFRAGDHFGELALLHGGLRTADVLAVTPMVLLALDAREFGSMLMTTPKISLKMLSHLAERLADADAQYTD